MLCVPPHLQVVNLEDPALDALFDEVGGAAWPSSVLLFGAFLAAHLLDVVCVHVVRTASATAACLPGYSVVVCAAPTKQAGFYAATGPISEHSAFCVSPTCLFTTLLLQADAGKPMKHFSPQYPPDADPSLAMVSRSKPCSNAYSSSNSTALHIKGLIL
jgi:hypothetical protein